MTLLETLQKNRPNYCHVIEVANLNELKSTLEGAFETFTGEGWDEDEVKDTLSSLTIYVTAEGSDEDEEEVFNFDEIKFIESL